MYSKHSQILILQWSKWTTALRINISKERFSSFQHIVGDGPAIINIFKFQFKPEQIIEPALANVGK